MKTTVKTALLSALAGGLILTVIWVSVWAVLRTQGTARAQAPVVTTLAIDMVTAGNDDHTVGAIDACVAVSAGASVEFDVVLDAIPTGRDLDGYQYFMGFDDTNLTFTNQQHTGYPPAGPNGINIISRNPAPAPTSCSGLLGCIDASEAVPDPPSSDSFDELSVHQVFVVDSTTGITVGFGSDDPWAGAGGVLGRYSIAVGPAAPAGIYAIGLNDSAVFSIRVQDAASTPIWDLPANATDDDADGAIDEDLMLDRTAGYGLIAVDTPCPQPADMQKVALSVVNGEDWTNNPASCTDTIDNGGDGAADAADPDCVLAGGSVPVSTTAGYMLSETVQNNGPGAGVARITTTCIAPPPGGGLCSYHVKAGDSPDGDLEVTVDGGAPVINPPPSMVFQGNTITVVQRVNLAVGPPPTILNKDWDLQCLEPSSHAWEFTNTIAPESPFQPDPVPGNNSASANMTVNCLAQADLQINSMTVTMDAIDNDGDTVVDEDAFDGLDNDGDLRVDEDWAGLYEADDGYDDDADTLIDEDGKGDCDGDANPDDDGDGWADEDGGDCPIIRVHKVIENQGPWGPAATNVVVVAAPFTAIQSPSPCVLTPLPSMSQVNLELTIIQNHEEAFVMDCPKLGFEVDDDGDRNEGAARFANNCSDAIDNDSDTLIDYSDPDCNIKVDEDPPDTVDNDSDGYVDEDGPQSVVNIAAYDLLVPKDPHILDADLGAPGCDPMDPQTWATSCGDNGAQAQVVLNDVLPHHPTFTGTVDEADPSSTVLHPGLPFDDNCLTTLPCKRQFDVSTDGGSPLILPIYNQPSALSITAGPAIPNGELVGAVTGVARAGVLNGLCVNPFPVTANLYDCALSAVDGEGPNDVPSALLALTGPPGGNGAQSWSTKLDSIKNMLAPAPLIGRKCGFVMMVGMPVPVNVLVFADGAGGTMEWLQVFDPDVDTDGVYDPVDPDDDNDLIPDALDPDADGNGTPNELETITDWCTPYEAKLLELGQSSPGGVTLAACTTPGTHLMSTTIFREDIGTQSTILDQFACAPISEADVEVKSVAASTLPPPVPPLAAATIIVGEDTPLELTTVVHNNGPDGPVDTDITSTATITGYVGGNPSQWSTWGAQGCSLAPVVSQGVRSLDVSVDEAIIDGYSINCDMGGLGRDDDGDLLVDEDPLGGTGIDNDGDGLIDEDWCNATDDDADTLTDEDPPTGDEDCDAAIDEDSPFYLVNVAFSSTTDPLDPNVIDPQADNNSKDLALTLAVLRPFTPSYSMIIDDVQPDQQTDPVDDDCVVGLPCKTLGEAIVPNIPPPGGQPWGQPLSSLLAVIGSQPGQWSHASGPNVPNGEEVGKTDYQFSVSIPGLTTACNVPVAGVSVLYDACLPPPGDPYIPGSYLAEPGCSLDMPSRPAALAPAAAFTSWSTSLDSIVRQIYTWQPTAYLWARYSSVGGPPLNLVVNVLVFDLSGGAGAGPWLSVPVVGDPTQQPPGSPYFCPPFLGHLLILGQTPTSAVPILTCNQASPSHSTAIALFRDDIGTSTVLYDDVSCTPSETDASVSLSKDENVGNEAPMSEGGTCDDGVDNDADGYVDLADADCDRLGAGIAKDYPVTVQVVNGEGPADIAVDLSIVSHDPCQADWLPEPGDTLLPPSRVGDTYTSQLQWTEASMGGLEVRQAVRYYSLHCTEPGTFSGAQAIQVTATVTASMPDPNPGNNEATNQIASISAVADIDDDTFGNDADNCPLVANADQANTDGDSLGNACDPDDDNDTVLDDIDNCPLASNADQTDADGDALGDACDSDDDNDGFTDVQENSLGSDPLNPSSTPEHISLPSTCTDGTDNDLDGLPDLFDCDNDGDGIANYFDTCPLKAEDADGHQDDDGCPDTDNDMDGVCDPWATPSQPACTGSDSCPNVAEDADSFHDTDGCPDPDNDGDGFPDSTDQCPATDWTAGPDGIPDTGDEPHDESGVPIQTKEDYDGVIDVDGCHDSPGDDWDGDGIADETEAFVAGTNPMDMDSDDDGLCDGSAPPVCGSEDLNNNGLVDPGETDPLSPDSDGDGLTDGLERGLAEPETPGTNVFSPNWQPDLDPATTTDPLDPDTDGDSLPDGFEDADQDGQRDAEETSPSSGDTDADGHGDTGDNCPVVSNPGQEDFEPDGIGDRCDDSDTDAFTDYVEFYVGTDVVDACPDNPGDDCWPPDIDANRLVDITDALLFLAALPSAEGSPQYSRRVDLAASDGVTDITDAIVFLAYLPSACTNP